MRFVVAVVLALSMTPGMSEVAEAAVHLVLHADLPHHADEADHERGCNEHTCTPLAHHCGCHATMSAQTVSRVAGPADAGDVSTLEPCAIETDIGRQSEPPPLRPPIA